MHIILLSGKPYSGKSETMHLVFDEITAHGTRNVVSPKKYLNEKRDFECVVAYNKKQVAVCSGGDYLWYCIEKIIQYTNVDYLLLSYSDKFATNLSVMLKQYGHHCVVKKTRSNKSDADQKRVNELDRDNIIACIK